MSRRYSIMVRKGRVMFTNGSHDPQARKGGNFIDATDRLLPLFGDADGRGGRKWDYAFEPAKPLSVALRELGFGRSES